MNLIFTNDIASIFRPTIIKMHFLEVHLSTLNVMYVRSQGFIFSGGWGIILFSKVLDTLDSLLLDQHM